MTDRQIDAGKREEAPPDQLFPRPSIKDWLLVAIGTIFVLCGLVILPSDFNVGIVTLAFFGCCLAVSILNIRRKLRFRRPTPLRVEIVGGVPILPSTNRLLAISAMMTGLGLVLVIFGRGYGLVFWALAWFILAVGCVLIAGLILGLWSAEFLQFDPEGMTIGHRRLIYTVPWEAIGQMGSGEISQNPLLVILLAHPDHVSVRPPGTLAQAAKQFAKSRRWTGGDITLMPARYGMDLPLLMQALDRYIADPDARRELGRKQLNQ